MVQSSFSFFFSFSRAVVNHEISPTGQILAEQIDWARTQTIYRGLHFPETDIPCQARELYAVSPLRLLADVRITLFSSAFLLYPILIRVLYFSEKRSWLECVADR